MADNFETNDNDGESVAEPAVTSGPVSSRRSSKHLLVKAAILATAGVGSFGAASLAGAQVGEPTTTTAETTTDDGAIADTGAEGKTASGDCDEGNERGEGRGDERGMGRGEARSARHGEEGSVTAIDDASITLTDDEGEASTLAIDATTTVRRTSEANLADLSVGEQVRVRGERSDDGTSMTATSVQVGEIAMPKHNEASPDSAAPDSAAPDSAAPDSAAPDSAAPNSAPEQRSDGERGRGGRDGRGVAVIASIDANGFTLTTSDGDTVTVIVSADTTYTRTASAAISDIAVGDTVSVRSDRDQQVARSITIE